MRQDIGTAPHDGRAIVLEDGPSGTYQIAEWSKSAATWLDENGHPVNIEPAYWHALPSDPSSEEDASIRRDRTRTPRMATVIIVVALITAGGIYSRSHIETNISYPAIQQQVGRYLSTIVHLGWLSVERTSAFVARGLASVRQLAPPQGWLIQVGQITDHLGKVWQYEILRQGVSRCAGSLASADFAGASSGYDHASDGPELQFAELVSANAGSEQTAQPVNGRDLSSSQLDGKNLQNQTIEPDLGAAHRQIELNARLNEFREKARREEAATEEKAQQRIDSLLRDAETARQAQEASAAALIIAQNEIRDQKMRAEKAVVDARRDRDKGRMLARQLAEARTEIEIRTATLNDLRRKADQAKQQSERVTTERQHEQALRMQGN